MFLLKKNNNIFFSEFFQIKELKILSLVCWEWYHEIAFVWKENININLKTLTEIEYNKNKEILKKSQRYYSNIKIPSSALEVCDIDTSLYLEVIKLIRSRDSMTYTNNIKNVIFFGLGSNWNPEKIVDIFTALGNQMDSVRFEDITMSRVPMKLLTLGTGFLENLRDIAKNIKSLSVGLKGPNEFATVCTNLQSLRVCLSNEDDGSILEKIFTKNQNIRHLNFGLYYDGNIQFLDSLKNLTTLEVNGKKYYPNIKLNPFLNVQFIGLRSLVVSNCILDANDLRAMEKNIPNLVKLNLTLQSNDILIEPKFQLIKYCCGLKFLKELKLIFTGFRMNFQYNTIFFCSDTINYSLSEAGFKNMFFNQLLLTKITRVTPNILTLNLEDIELDFGVDSFFHCLKDLPFLQNLTLKW